MKKLGLVLLASLSLAACATSQQSADTAAGAVGGAIVGGPVGAVVGGVAGAVVGAPGGPLDPGYCYMRGPSGEILHHSDGRPRVRRC
jgi:hypothetical protein